MLVGWSGVGPLKRVSGTPGAARYVFDIIHDIEQLCPQMSHTGQPLVFQQDLAPAHSDNTNKIFLQESGYQILPWVGNSPDFNIIENVWSDLSRRVSRRPRPATADELWKIIPAFPFRCYCASQFLHNSHDFCSQVFINSTFLNFILTETDFLHRVVQCVVVVRGAVLFAQSA